MPPDQQLLDPVSHQPLSTIIARKKPFPIDAFPGCRAILEAGKFKETVYRYVRSHLVSPAVLRLMALLVWQMKLHSFGVLGDERQIKRELEMKAKKKTQTGSDSTGGDGTAKIMDQTSALPSSAELLPAEAKAQVVTSGLGAAPGDLPALNLPLERETSAVRFSSAPAEVIPTTPALPSTPVHAAAAHATVAAPPSLGSGRLDSVSPPPALPSSLSFSSLSASTILAVGRSDSDHAATGTDGTSLLDPAHEAQLMLNAGVYDIAKACSFHIPIEQLSLQYHDLHARFPFSRWEHSSLVGLMSDLGAGLGEPGYGEGEAPSDESEDEDRMQLEDEEELMEITGVQEAADEEVQQVP